MQNEITVIDSAELSTVSRLTEEIKLDLKSAQQSLVKACVKLAEVRTKKLYKALNCRNFEEYCENELGIKRKQGFKYATIGEFVRLKNVQSTGHFELEQFQELSVEKLYLIARAKEPVREEIAKAVDLNNTTVRELKAKISELEQQNKRISDRIDDRFDRLERQIQADKEKSEIKQCGISEKNAKPVEEKQSPEKPSFILYNNYLKFVAEFSNEEAGELFKAILLYTNNKPVPKLSKGVKTAFLILSDQIDRDYDSWLEIKKKRTEAVNRRWKNEREENTNEYNCNLCNTNDTVNVNANVNDNDNVNDIVNVNANVIDNVNNDCQPADKSGDNINYRRILDMFHEICVSYPKVQTVTEKRAKSIENLLKKFTVDDFGTVFKKMEKSEFLSGKVKRQQGEFQNWKASFDFAVKEENFVKILEGVYDDVETDKKDNFDKYYQFVNVFD